MSKKSSTDAILLSKKLIDEGYNALATIDNANKVMEAVDVTEDSVSKGLIVLVRTHSKLPGNADGQTWNVENFAESIFKKNPNLNLISTFAKLDQAEFMLYDPIGLRILINFWKYATKDEPFPVQIFLQPWMHVRGQLSVLYHMVYASPDLINMAKTATKKVIPEEIIPVLPLSMRQAATQLASQQLNCLGLLESIMDLAGTAASEDVKVLMDRLAIQSPELLMIGLAQIQPVKNELHRSLLPKLLNIFLVGHVNSALVIRLLWQVQPNLLLEGFFDMYKKDPTSISRVLDLAQEAKIVGNILKTDIQYFTLDLASLAARRQNLNLEKWLMDKLAKDGFLFFGNCVEFLEKKIAIEMARQSGANVIPAMQLSMEVIRIFFKVLTERPLPPNETAKLAKLSQLYTQMYPQLSDNRPQPEKKPAGANDPTESKRNYSEEVEEMVRLYFERLYTKDISPSRFASVLKVCRTSNDQRQVNFFSCTIHTLLDEAQFFTQYPENELMVTGELLGLLIEQHLISYSALRTALKYVLDSLKFPVGSKVFNFGIQALTQFKSRLFEWPQYTLLLSKIEGLRSFPPIAESIALTLKQLAQRDTEDKMAALTSQSGGSSPKVSAPVSDASHVAEKSAESAPNVATLLQHAQKQSYETPPDKVQERISFLVNNLSTANMKSKAVEMKQLLQKSTWGWFSHYLVVRRVSIEPNNHELYSNLLDELEMQALTDTVVDETFLNIRLLLSSENTAKSSSDRNLLKNLGLWLGRLTIGKSKPIRHKDLSIKDLLITAYEKNELVVAIPFVCKILQHASYSKVFKPPNPWVMGCLKLLAELYWTEGLKLNLKFEIEILYKTFNLDLNEVEPTSLLGKQEPPGISTPVNKPATSFANSPATSQKSVPKSVVEEQLQPPPINVPVASPAAPMNATPTQANKSRQNIDITPVLSKLQINPAIGQLMIQHPIIKQTVYAGVSEAFYENVPSIIASSANIAAISTRETILKDFATEPDETRLQLAAHAMVQTLASSFCVVTCKEPLCSGIISMISTSLTQNGLPEPLAEEIASTVANENIELLCLFVDQLTKVKALEEIDRGLAPAYASRIAYRKQHQQMPNNNDRYFDVLSLNGAPHSIQLPEVLRPTRGVNMDQLRLYESFDQRSFLANQQQLHQQQLQQQLSPAHFHPEAMGHPLQQPQPQQQPFMGGESPNPALANKANLLNAKLEQMLLELDRLIRNCNITNISQLPPNHDICLLIRQIPLLVSQSPQPLQTMVTFVEKVVLMLYQSNSPFGLEVYTMFLQSLFEISAEVTKETLSWLIYADDERKYNPSAIAMLIRYELLPLEEYDVQLAKLINAKADSVIDFATNLMRICLLSEQPVTFLEDHILTVSSLYKLVKNDEASPNIIALIDGLRKQVEEPYKDIKKDIDCLELRMLLAEWVRLCQHPMTTDDIFRTLAENVMKKTSEEDHRYFFFRICTETCINHYLIFRSVSTIHHRRMIHLIDSYTKLISAMVIEEKESDSAKIRLLNDALSVMILVLSYHHENKGIEFNQKPFLRLFSSLFNEVNKFSAKSIDNSAIITFSDALYTLQPNNFPGFAFSWLQLISNRSFLPQLLVTNDNNGAMLCQKLILALLKFLSPLLECQELPHATKIFYRGTLRVLVVLLHDFPEFLCSNYIVFSQAIPNSCIQLRNLILSAFPRTMHLPDPFTPDLKLESLPESSEEPLFDQSYVGILNDNDFKTKIDEFVTSKDTAQFFKVLESQVERKQQPVDKHSYETLFAFTLYIGFKSAQLKDINITSSPAFLAYNHLLSTLDSEGRYNVISAIADNLRYPNSHTCFFSIALLNLFSKQSETVKEQITRVLLERLIVNRPHPWGLLTSFIELIKDSKFWEHEFIRCSPDIERLFDNVSRSIKQTTLINA